ncbi:hypothetical protein [Streptomyces sp. NPDC005017]|uniref:hypothetical protein n=1 Tax=Streptomyces sp. NPDC005017 TaxID=3364706 RepID=UPI0036911F35
MAVRITPSVVAMEPGLYDGQGGSHGYNSRMRSESRRRVGSRPEFRLYRVPYALGRGDEEVLRRHGSRRTHDSLKLFQLVTALCAPLEMVALPLGGAGIGAEREVVQLLRVQVLGHTPPPRVPGGVLGHGSGEVQA